MAQRKNIMLGTAGHVDHGKTALVKILTGCNTDSLAEEQQRGLTIDIGFAPCKMADDRIVGVIDVPGHVDFVRNMTAGAHGVDVVIFVIAADDGVMPQTREHLDILTFMGVRQGLVALTKIDLVDAAMRELVIDEVRQFLHGTFLENAAICPVSNITGEGYEGFLSALNAAVESCPPRESAGLFRLWVEDVFSIKGFGTVATGIPISGEVHVGQKVRLLPGEQVGRVRRLEVYGEESTVGRAGECVAINLADISHEGAARGQLLCQGESLAPASMIEADLNLLPKLPGAVPDYAEVHFHVGTAGVMCNVAILDAKEIPPGGRALVQLRLQSPLCVVPGDRFILRASMPGLAGGLLTTIGGGRILATSNIRLRRNRPWTIDMLSARRAALDSSLAWCEQMLKESQEPLTAAALADRCQMPPDRIEPLVKQLLESGAARKTAEGLFVHRQAIERAVGKILETLDAFHAANKMRLGMPEGDLAAALALPAGMYTLAMEQLSRAGKVQKRSAVVLLPGKAPNISNADMELCQKVEAALAGGGLAPPGPSELATQLALPPAKIDALVRLLCDQGRAVRLDAAVVMHIDAVEKARKVVLDLFAQKSGFETVEFRDALGVSRKFAVPLLDWFDTQRLTVRSGSRRTPGFAAKKAP